MQCPFCALPALRVVAEDPLTITIRDAYPVSRGHTLVITRRHVASLFDATDEERRALWAALTNARSLIAAEHGPDGWNVGVNDGIAAGQTVMHLHLHLIPRFQDDTPDPRGGVRHVIPGKGYYSADPDPK
jgi:diadenosine tetraphosphate (Ap4A) HIT family hydrolase